MAAARAVASAATEVLIAAARAVVSDAIAAARAVASAVIAADRASVSLLIARAVFCGRLPIGVDRSVASSDEVIDSFSTPNKCATSAAVVPAVPAAALKGPVIPLVEM
jgi:hypothetical protein